MKSLFRIAGFTPYVLILFLNAMTDLGHKIVLQNTIFKAYTGSELIILTAVVNGMILLPFIFLFSPAGYISDRYPKTKVIKYASLLAVMITILILASYYMGWFWMAFGLTFVLAAQSAIYSPAKYGLIKEMVGNDKLAGANALVQAVTIISMLAGAVVYSLYFEKLLGDASTDPSEILKHIAPLGYLLIGASVMEFLLANRLAGLAAGVDPGSSFHVKRYSNLSYLKENLGAMFENRTVWLSIVGLSVFWGISQVVVAVFGDFLKESLGVTNTVVAQGLLALSGLGIIIGSLFAGRVSRNHIETGIIPLGALGIALSVYVLPSLESMWGIGLDIFLFGVFSGLFIVPLNSLIQFATPTSSLGKVLAGNNFVQSVVMFLFLVMTALFAYFHVSSTMLLYIVALIAFVGMVYTFIKLPQSLVRYAVRIVFGLRYRIEVEGLENIKPEGKGVLLLGNHVSFLDWAMLQIAYPKQIRFVMDRIYYDKWYLKPIFTFFGVIPISSRGSKRALSLVSEALEAGDTVALFPEGHLSRNGHLGTFKKGFAVAAESVENAVIVPFHLRGLWEDDFSYASGKMKRNASRDISINFGHMMDIHATPAEVKQAVFELSIVAWRRYARTLPSLQEAWMTRAKEMGRNLCVADSTGVEMSHNRFVTATLLLAQKLRPLLGDEQNIGIILPTSAAGVMGNMALLSLRKTIVNLNYSSGIPSLNHATKVAKIRRIVTSETFVTRLKAKGFDLTDILEAEGIEVIYLEALKKSISKAASLWMYAQVRFAPTSWLMARYIYAADPESTAAILFSSGSEGTPKGIALSHRNLMGNIKQTTTLLNPTDEDVMLGTLPIFHSFGLTVTTLLPLIEGIPVVCHPDPTDGFGIGKIAAKYRATMLFATATFFRLYVRNRKLHPLMFADLRLVVAGAEKLPDEIREAFKIKFGKEIYEGYGATETTPVASVNIQDVLMTDSWQVQKGNKPGTVGLPLPGSSFKIVDPDTFDPLPVGEDGMILIGGTQIMQGYIGDPDKTAAVIHEADGIRWYITGDKGHLDEDGFLTIVDRYSRFAKIGGEMVSLGLVEREISSVLDESEEIAVAAVPDPKKGERIVLLYTGEAEVEMLQKRIKSLNLNPLFLPAEYHKVDALPKLGSGKADYKGAKALAMELCD